MTFPERVTRRYWSRVPVYRTGYRDPFNWTLVRALDVIPMIVVWVLVPTGRLFVTLFLLAVAWFVMRFAWRLRCRALWCVEHGHQPYQPVVGLNVWRCWTCGADLDGPWESVPAVRREAQRVSQSFYSDRR